jgi:hypothetical protein
MKTLLKLLAGLPMAMLAVTAAAADPAKTAESTMRVMLNGSAETAFPLFGPQLESTWAPPWKPRFLQPADGHQDAAGAVFLTQGHQGEALWVMTRYDTKERAIDYVRVLPGRLVTRIQIRVTATSPHSAAADVTYRLTSLGSEGDPLIEQFNRSFPAERAEWERAINGVLQDPNAPHH